MLKYQFSYEMSEWFEVKGTGLTKDFSHRTALLFKNPNCEEVLQIIDRVLFILCTFPEAGNRAALFNARPLILTRNCSRSLIPFVALVCLESAI